MDAETLCATTRMRIATALAVGHSLDPERTWYVTLGGDVPYKKGSPTLGTLEKRWLVSRGIPQDRILVQTGGCSTFAEARSATNLIDQKLTGKKMIHLVSSDWWLTSGLPVWRNIAWFARCDAVPVTGTGGRKTRRKYAVYSRLIRFAYWAACENALERFFTKHYAGRVNGFTENGCA